MSAKDRFRRALIGHYISGEAEEVGGGKVLRLADGEPIQLHVSPEGTLCGVWRGDAIEIIERESLKPTVAE